MATRGPRRFRYDVFISYSHRNRDWVDGWLVSQLKNAGLKVCIDHEDFEPGAPSITEMERAVLQSRKTVLILTPEYLQSSWAEYENILVQTLDPAAHERRLVPLLFSQCEMPLRLSSLTYLDFTQSAEHGAGLKRLVSVIRQRLAVSRKRNTATTSLVLSFEVPTGTLTPSSPVYIERPSDLVLQQQVARDGSTTHVEGARQMGKSSLLQKVLAHASTRQYAVVDIDFQRSVDEPYLARLDTLLRYLANIFHTRLKLATAPDETWKGPLSAKEKLTSYLEEYGLQGASLPTILVMDEVDRIFGRDYQNDFFGLLRSWHNLRTGGAPVWKRFHLVLAYAYDPQQAITGLDQSPFNVGKRIRLADFSAEEVRELNRRYGRPLKNSMQVQQLTDAIGGHPYLIQQALYALAAGTHTLPELFDVRNADASPFVDHLQAHVSRLMAMPELRHAMLQTLQNGHCPSYATFLRLRAMGLVTGQHQRAVSPRCSLYAAYFREMLQ